MTRQLGYPPIMPVDISLNYEYDRPHQILNLRTLKISSDKVASVELGCKMGNVQLKPEELFGLFFGFSQIRLYEARIEYEDKSLVDRLFTMEAKRRHTTNKNLKRRILRELDREIQRAKNSFEKNALKSIRGFLENPGTLRISIHPQRPLTLQRIFRARGPYHLIRTLGLKIEAS